MTDLTDLCKRIYDVSPGYRDDADWSPAVAVLREALTEGVDHQDVQRVLFALDTLRIGGLLSLFKSGTDAFDRILAAKEATK
jgi:hypothetical protein